MDAAPLRAVTKRVRKADRQVDELECGHRYWLVGTRRTAARHRCDQCKRDAESRENRDAAMAWYDQYRKPFESPPARVNVLIRGENAIVIDDARGVWTIPAPKKIAPSRLGSMLPYPITL